MEAKLALSLAPALGRMHPMQPMQPMLAVPGMESAWLPARFLALARHKTLANEAQFERQIEIDCDI